MKLDLFDLHKIFEKIQIYTSLVFCFFLIYCFYFAEFLLLINTYKIFFYIFLMVTFFEIIIQPMLYYWFKDYIFKVMKRDLILFLLFGSLSIICAYFIIYYFYYVNVLMALILIGLYSLIFFVFENKMTSHVRFVLGDMKKGVVPYKIGDYESGLLSYANRLMVNYALFIFLLVLSIFLLVNEFAFFIFCCVLSYFIYKCLYYDCFKLAIFNIAVFNCSFALFMNDFKVYIGDLLTIYFWNNLTSFNIFLCCFLTLFYNIYLNTSVIKSNRHKIDKFKTNYDYLYHESHQ